MQTNNPNKYFAFISYKREDEEWAVWFHHELENYHLPATLNGRADLPTEFRPVFRDIDELKAGNLPEQIYDALATSAYLIVICSPNSAKSKWVNKEIEDFIEIGKAKGVDNVRNIFPFIVEGCPHAKNEAEECFPTALLNLQDKEERIGGNVNESGRDMAFVKVLAGMLSDVAFDELWNRYERDKAEEERKKREERNKLLISQSRFAAEKANKLVEEGDSYTARRLLLEVMPKSINNPDRPYVIEAEAALRNASYHNTAIFYGYMVYSMSLSPKGDSFAISTYKNETLKVLEVKNGMEVLSIFSNMGKIAFSPNGQYIASLTSSRFFFDRNRNKHRSNSITIWNAKTGAAIQSLDDPKANGEVAFSPDGKRIVYASRNTIKIRTIESGVILSTFEGHTDSIRYVAFGPDGKRVVSASADGTIRIWDATTGEQLQCLKGGKYGVSYAQYSPSGKLILSIDHGKTILIWDAATGEQLQCLKGHTDIVTCAVFSPDEKRVVSVSDDKTIRIWNIANGEQLQCLIGHADKVGFVGWCPDGKRIISASKDRTIRFWDVEPQGQQLSMTRESGFSARITIATFSPDGNRIVSASLGKSILIWDVATRDQLKCLKGHDVFFKNATFSPDGKRVVSASSDSTIRIWDVKTGLQLKCLKEPSGEVRSVVYSTDGERVVSVSRRGIVRIWDVETGIGIMSFQGDEAPSYSACFSPDGKKIVYALYRAVAIWDAEKGHIYLGGHFGKILAVTFSPDGKQVASASEDNTIKLWDIYNGREIQSMEGHTDSVNSVAFSPDGKRVVSASDDRSIRIWDVETGMEIQSIHGHSYGVESASFSPDGKQIVSSDGRDIRIWSFPPLQDLIDQTRERFKDRPLTQEEREQYYLE